MQLLGGLIGNQVGAGAGPGAQAPLGLMNTAPGTAVPAGAPSQNPILSAMLSAAGANINPMAQQLVSAVTGGGPTPAPAQAGIRPQFPIPPTKPISTPPAIAATGGAPSPQTMSPTQRSGPAPALADQLPGLFESQNNLLLKAMQRRAREGQGGGVRGGR